MYVYKKNLCFIWNNYNWDNLFDIYEIIFFLWAILLWKLKIMHIVFSYNNDRDQYKFIEGKSCSLRINSIVMILTSNFFFFFFLLCFQIKYVWWLIHTQNIRLRNPHWAGVKRLSVATATTATTTNHITWNATR